MPKCMLWLAMFCRNSRDVLALSTTSTRQGRSLLAKATCNWPSVLSCQGMSPMGLLSEASKVWSTTAPHAQDFVQDQQRSTHADAGIGHVEGREVPSAPVKVQKVDHVAVQQAVDDVANGPAQDE